MKLERTVPYLRQGKRIFRQAWRDAGEDGETLDFLFVSIDDNEHFIIERESTLFVEDTNQFDMTVEDLLANDWRVEEDTTERTKTHGLLRFFGLSEDECVANAGCPLAALSKA